MKILRGPPIYRIVHDEGVFGGGMQIAPPAKIDGRPGELESRRPGNFSAAFRITGMRTTLGFLFALLAPYGVVRYIESPDGELIRRQTNPGVQLQGRRNMAAGLDFAVKEKLRVGSRLLERSDVNYYFQFDPGRRFSRIGFNGALGDSIDFANVRVGQGGSLGLFGTVRPTDHLALDFNADRQWLDVKAGRASTTFPCATRAAPSPAWNSQPL